MAGTSQLTPQERMGKAAALLEFLESQAIEDGDDLADVIGIAVRAKLGSLGAEGAIRAMALKQL